VHTEAYTTPRQTYRHTHTHTQSRTAHNFKIDQLEEDRTQGVASVGVGARRGDTAAVSMDTFCLVSASRLARAVFSLMARANSSRSCDASCRRCRSSSSARIFAASSASAWPPVTTAR
jgi:hypothetical protein